MNALHQANGAASPTSNRCDSYTQEDGVFRPPVPVSHRDEDYSPSGFETLARMQTDHFWYRGRHRFLWYGVRRYVPALRDRKPLRVIDIGCGCGGWLREFAQRWEGAEVELAGGDSSLHALRHSAETLPDWVSRYQVDLANLHWTNRWDVVFLLDVIEHLPDDRGAMRQVWQAMAPGGLVFLTAPALQRFWTWNDELAGHQRRYSKVDLTVLAKETGFEIRDCRYFMFFLSPLLLVTRWCARRKATACSPEQLTELANSMHRVPNALPNSLLGTVFACETPLGHYVSFPWGTSILGVFQKPGSFRSEDARSSGANSA